MTRRKEKWALAIGAVVGKGVAVGEFFIYDTPIAQSIIIGIGAGAMVVLGCIVLLHE